MKKSLAIYLYIYISIYTIDVLIYTHSHRTAYLSVLYEALDSKPLLSAGSFKRDLADA